jgi:putative FmdB family regulatory protein
MPIYEFACQDCGHEFEKIQSFSDSTTPACPNCQGRHVQRRMSAPAIHFKGSGWYITDSKSAGKSSASGPSNGDEAKPETDKSAAAKADGSTADSGKSDGSSATAASKPAASEASAS